MNRNRWRILHIVNLGTFMSTLDVGIVHVALPAMAQQFQVSLSGVQWIVTSYLLTMVALLPFLGKLSDRLSRSAVYSFGFLVFSLGSAAAALSGGLGMMIASRCVQGLGAAMIMANSQAMVRELFPDHERGRALGINAVVIALGSLSGPALGGVIVAYADWPALFLINVPLGIAALLLGLRWFPKFPKRDKTAASLDLTGSLMLAAGTVLLLLGTVGLEQGGRTAAAVWQGAAGLLLFAVLIVYERRIQDGILDPDLFRRRSIWTGNASAFAVHLIQMASLIPVIFYMEGVLGYSPIKLGLLLAIQPLMMGVAAPLSGWFRDRYGAFVPLIAGPCLCGLSFLPLAAGGEISLSGLVVYLAGFGAGIGCFQSTNNAEIMSAAPAEKASLAGSLLALIRYLGMIGGTALAALFVGELGGSLDPETAARHVRYLFIICLVLAAAVAGIGILRPRRRPESAAA